MSTSQTTTDRLNEARTMLEERAPEADERFAGFLAAWLEARGDRLVPLRKAFTPYAIAPLLRYIWIYRYDGERREFYCELAGESVNDAWCGNIRGRSLREIVGDRDHQLVIDRWTYLLNEPAIQYGAVDQYVNGLGEWHAERLILPMASAEDHVDVVLGLSLYQTGHLLSDATANVSETVRQFPCRDLS